MKTITLLALSLCLLVFGASAQTTTPAADTDIFGAGATFNGSFAFTGLYARLVANDTYAFTVADAVPTGVKPAVTTDVSVSVGVARRFATIGSTKFYIPTAAGPTFSGKNTGWNWSTGLLASVPIGSGGFRLMPNVRVLKSSISENGYSWMGGFMFGWGKP